MEYKNIAQKVIAGKANNIIKIGVTDESNAAYVSYVLMSDASFKKFEKDKGIQHPLKLEDYGTVYCSIPGKDVSETLEKTILARME